MEAQSSLVDSALDRLSGLRILVDARKLSDGGIGVYLHNLLSGLSKYSKAEITVIVDDPRKISSDWDVNVIEDQTKLNSIDELFNFGKKIDFTKYDLFHTPHFVLPYGIKIPTIVTIHDTIHITHPEKFFYPYFAKSLIRSAIKRASAVITVSESSKADLVGLYPKYADKINVVRNAITAEFLKKPDDLSVLSRFKLNGKYLLGIFSNLKPHKGLDDLLTTFCEIDSDYQLVLVGQGIELLVENQTLLDKACSSKVKLLGRVDTKELVALCAGAKGLVVPTFAEGFCLPILEAHSQNTPVVMRPVPACLELACSNDVVCKDMTLSALKQGIETLIKTEKCKLDLQCTISGLDLFSVSEQLAKTYLQAL